MWEGSLSGSAGLGATHCPWKTPAGDSQDGTTGASSTAHEALEPTGGWGSWGAEPGPGQGSLLWGLPPWVCLSQRRSRV